MNPMFLNSDLEKYHFKELKEFDVGMIIFDPLVRKLCEQNVCGHFGKNHMCPPAVIEIDAWRNEITSYQNAAIVTKVYPTIVTVIQPYIVLVLDPLRKIQPKNLL